MNNNESLEDLLGSDSSRFILLWGPPGAGKTVFAHAFPRTRTLDLDQGMASVAWAIKSGLIKKKLSEIVYRTVVEEEIEQGHVVKSTALDQCTDILDEWATETDEFDTLIIDSGTTLTDYVINSGLDQNAALGMSKSKSDSKRAGGMRVMRQQDWGGASSLFQDMINWLRGSDFKDKTIILICHEYEVTTDAGNIKKLLPLLIGQLRQRIPKDFGEVYHLSVKGLKDKPEYVMQTAKDALHDCKSRYGCLPAVMPTDYNLWRKTIDDFWK